MKVDLKKYLGMELVKKLGRIIYQEVLYKAAQEYVQRTDNDWDDKGLAYVDQFVRDFLAMDEG